MRKGLLRFALVGSLSLGVPAGAYSGSITGGVRFGDDPPKLSAVKVTKDQDYCGETLPNETYVIESNGGLKNVVGKRRLSCGTPVHDVIHSRRKLDSEWSRHGLITRRGDFD